MILSVITIVKNRVGDIAETIKSIVGQKTNDVEYVVIDGASDDGTADVIQGYLSDIDLFVSEPDGGIYDAINKGIKKASGRYILLIHGGDQLNPGVLERILLRIRDGSSRIFYGSVAQMRDGVFVSVIGSHHSNLEKYMIPHPGMIIPKEFHELYGYYDTSFRIVSDYKLAKFFLKKGLPFEWIPEIVAFFDLSGISQQEAKLLEEQKRLAVEQGEFATIPKKHLKRRVYEYFKNQIKKAINW